MMSSNRTLSEVIADAGDEPSPLYKQVKQGIINQILHGHWQPPQRVPAASERVAELGFSRRTINRALRELTTEGYLLRLQGVGTFVNEMKAFTPMLEVNNISDEIKSRGHFHTSRVLQLGKQSAGDSMAMKFMLLPGVVLFHSVIVHYENDIPVQLEDRLVNPDIAPLYLHQDFTKTTPFAYLTQLAPLTAGEHTIEAVMASHDEQRLLNIHQTEPCLQTLRRTWHHEKVVTCARLLYPGGRYKMFGSFKK